VFLRACGFIGCEVAQSGRNAPPFWRTLHVFPAGYTLKIGKSLTNLTRLPILMNAVCLYDYIEASKCSGITLFLISTEQCNHLSYISLKIVALLIMSAATLKLRPFTLITVEGTGKDQLKAGQQIVREATVLSHSSLLRNS